MRVLVLDAEQRSALAATRSLGRAGAEVVVASCRRNAIAAASKHCRRALRLTDPQDDAAGYVADVANAAADMQVDFVLPVTDTSTMLVTPARFAAGVSVLAPPTAVYERLTDKASLVGIADSLQVPCPASVIASTEDEVRAAVRNFSWPVVLKPGRSRYLHDGKVHATAVRLIRSAAELEEELRRSEWLGRIPGIVQEFIPGTGAGVFALHGPHGAAAWFAHRRLREKPPSGGVSVLSESVPPDPTLRAHAGRLLEYAGWHGPAMVEFRVAPDGTPFLMEVNGRFWGSLQLAIDAGVDFPRLLLEIGLGRSIPSPPDYQPGNRLRWLLGDLDNLLIRLRSGAGARAAIDALSGFFLTSLDTRVRQEVFRWTDPKPAAVELRSWLADLLR